MRQLFELDAKNYNPEGSVFARPSVRSIIITQGKVAMVHSLKYDYYKFPGGGIEAQEEPREALMRETREESGLVVIPSSIKPYGSVRRVQKGLDEDSIFLQENTYYFCAVESQCAQQHLDDYEAEERFTLEFVAPQTAIEVNREHPHGPKDQIMIEREARVLELLIQEGYFNS